MKAQNLEHLTDAARDLIAFLFTCPTGWTLTYMVEVRLDDPVEHLLAGGEGLERHGGNGSRGYAKHLGDPEWCVVHVDDIPDWDIATMAGRAIAQYKED